MTGGVSTRKIVEYQISTASPTIVTLNSCLSDIQNTSFRCVKICNAHLLAHRPDCLNIACCFAIGIAVLFMQRNFLTIDYRSRLVVSEVANPQNDCHLLFSRTVVPLIDWSITTTIIVVLRPRHNKISKRSTACIAQCLVANLRNAFRLFLSI